MNNASWRQVFIELCEAIFRDLGFDPPPMLHDDALPLAMELEVEQRAFELIHSSTDRPERILINCRLGSLPDGAGKAHYSAMLIENLRNARDLRPCFGINVDSDEVVWLSFENLDNLRAGAMLEKMRVLAFEASSWKDQIFNSQHGFDEHAAELSGATLA